MVKLTNDKHFIIASKVKTFLYLIYNFILKKIQRICMFLHAQLNPPISNTLYIIVIKEHCIYRIYGVNRFIEPISISPLLPD